MKNFKIIVIILVLLFSKQIYSQWEVAASYNIKNEIPNTGIGVQFGKNLPIQFPDAGIKLRLQIDFFNSTVSDFENGEELKLNYLNSDYQLSIIVSYFSRFIQPYAGIGLGAGHFIIEDYTKSSFFISGLAGFELNLFEDVIPFAEAQVLNYLSSFPEHEFKRDMTALIFKGIFGLRFKLNVID